MDITDLLILTIKHHASDLHLSADAPPMLRIDGKMKPLAQLEEGKEIEAFSHQDLYNKLCDTMNQAQRNQFDTDLELDFSFDFPSVGRFRVNVFYQSRGCAAVFRAIPITIPSLETLQAPRVLQDIANYKQGLVLVTGATGSGKSTTLAAMIDHINQNHPHHILTIEDPIEFVHTNKQSLINQREVQRDTLSFLAALKSALREDPDVILVGELRDQETIRLALTAAETGHLVLGTLHTNSARTAINRIIDAFSGEEKQMVRGLLSESLQAVISQTLFCKKDGGRVAAYEVMLATSAIRNLIREDKVAQMQSVLQTGAQLGMQTLQQSAQQLYQQQLITAQELEAQLGSQSMR